MSPAEVLEENSSAAQPDGTMDQDGPWFRVLPLALRSAPIRSSRFRMPCGERAVELAGGDLQAVMADFAEAAAGSNTRHPGMSDR
jgi:hypothetical protein